jgi:parvulin-like peptidyl-prolyl isomerase
MMQAFRKSAKPLIFIVAISFFAWLVLDLSGLSWGTGLLTATSVGKINGQSVDARAFQDAVSRFTEQRQRQSAEPLGIAELAQIRDQVWERFIQERLLGEEFDRWRVTTTAQEIAEGIRTAPPSEVYDLAQFQTDGKFDPSKYQRWLASAEGQSYVLVMEAEYRGQILQAKLARRLVSAMYHSDSELWQRFRDQEERVRVGLANVPASAISDAAVSVTPTEAEEYYRAHREEFHRDPTAFLSYVELDRRPIASDSAAARARADSLRAEILRGTPFEEVARRESADTVSGKDGGNLGEWTRGSFDSVFEETAFSIPLQRLSEPVLTRFGYHLIEVGARSGDKATGRHILVPIQVTGRHRDELDARADSLEALAADRLDLAALDTAARALGLAIQPSGPLVKDRPTTTVPDAAIWAFQATVGEHSPVIETPSSFYVFRVDSLWEEGIPPLDQVREQAAEKVRERKKLEQARLLAQDVLRRAAAGGTLEEATRGLGLRYEAVGPFSRLNAPAIGPVAVGAAFGLRTGQRSGVVEGPGGFVVLELLERTEADSAAFIQRQAQLRQQMLAAERQLYLQEYFAALRTRARIVDERARFYRTEAQVEEEAASRPVVPTVP